MYSGGKYTQTVSLKLIAGWLYFKRLDKFELKKHLQRTQLYTLLSTRWPSSNMKKKQFVCMHIVAVNMLDLKQQDFICEALIKSLKQQTWINAQACKQCLCKFWVFGVNFSNVPAFYIENAPKGLCKAKFASVSEKKYSMSVKQIRISSPI